MKHATKFFVLPNLVNITDIDYIQVANYTNGSFADPYDPSTLDPVCYTWFAFMGIVFALGLSNMGAAYGTAKSGLGLGSLAVTRPQFVYRSLIPIVMASILGI